MVCSKWGPLSIKLVDKFVSHDRWLDSNKMNHNQLCCRNDYLASPRALSGKAARQESNHVIILCTDKSRENIITQILCIPNNMLQLYRQLFSTVSLNFSLGQRIKVHMPFNMEKLWHCCRGETVVIILTVFIQKIGCNSPSACSFPVHPQSWIQFIFLIVHPSVSLLSSCTFFSLSFSFKCKFYLIYYASWWTRVL